MTKTKKLIYFFGVLLVLFIILILSRVPVVLKKEKTQETITFINSRKLSIEDVEGKNLPQKPNPSLVDATIAGIDANKNDIRDDVELAIFEKYPYDKKIRSAMLQYAMALQLELTHVFNSETWVAVVKQTDRGHGCVFQTGPDVSILDSEDVIKKSFTISRDRQDFVQELVFNTDQRKTAREKIQTKYVTSYGVDNKNDCDISL